MNALVAAVALPVAALVLAGLLRGGVGGRLVAAPTGERWHRETTPTFGGVGIFAGLAAGVGLAVAIGAVDGTAELWGILGGAALLFVAGLADDLRPLPPVVKLAAQFGAAAIALGSGLAVEIVGNDVLAAAIGVVWLVGITNAFNLLDNMDGLAASLAAVSCAVFAVDALAGDGRELGLVAALALGSACVGFLPFNLRPRRGAAVFMGDSGSQVIGFTLAALALAASWTTAGATLASVALPLLVLAVPILDTTFVTVRRTVERRPVTKGGTDHSSHRLVYYGLTEQQAVVALTLLAALLGATGLAYTVLDDARVTAVGLLVSFVVLTQFASFLGDLQQRAREVGAQPPPMWRAFFSNPRRLIEVVVDFAIVCASFLAAYLLQVDGRGTELQRALFLTTLPVLLGVRYVLFIVFGVYRRVWRYATARDLVAVVAAVLLSIPVTVAIVAAIRPLDELPPEVFVVDAAFCTGLVLASRLALRLHFRSGPQTRTRVLLVGAGRSGRALARELAESREQRVIGFLDDNPAVRRRRVLGVKVLGPLREAETHLAALRPDEVMITIPDAGDVAHVADAAAAAGIPCTTVRRTTERAPLAGVETG